MTDERDEKMVREFVATLASIGDGLGGGVGEFYLDLNALDFLDDTARAQGWTKIAAFPTSEMLRAAMDDAAEHDTGVEPDEEPPEDVASCEPEDAVYRRSLASLNFVGLILPPRLATEDLGDALERLSAMRSRGDARWRIGLRAGADVFWLVVNAIGELVRNLRGGKP